MTKFNKRGAESGTLQSLFLGLLVVTSVSVLVTIFFNSLATNYEVEINETQYEVFDRFDEVNQTLSTLTDPLFNEESQQTEATDIITTIITGAYNVIRLFFQVPGIFHDLINDATLAIGLPAIVGRLAEGIIITMILFAVLALIMKVRA